MVGSSEPSLDAAPLEGGIFSESGDGIHPKRLDNNRRVGATIFVFRFGCSAISKRTYSSPLCLLCIRNRRASRIGDLAR
jgi:hypothetical protein